MIEEPNTVSGKTQSEECKRIPPGSTIGILGGGQLGRMLAMAASAMGYRTAVFDSDGECPAAGVCDSFFHAAYTDDMALRGFAETIDVATLEFENVPREALEVISATHPVRPGPGVLHICQHREREKEFLRARGFPCAPFRVVDSAAALEEAMRGIGFPAVLKSADSGYDGKGQIKIPTSEPAQPLWERLASRRAVLEQWVPFDAELSVVVARGLDGTTTAFPPFENIHANHILDTTLWPARFDPRVLDEAVTLATRIAGDLAVTGLLTVEFFLCGDGRLLVNELAPRTHNSGHATLDACATSQFEQQVRAVCGLPLGSTRILAPAAMANLLGDLWSDGEPDWAAALADPRVALHLYGKTSPRRGRKMGHLTALGDSPADAFEAVVNARRRLAHGGASENPLASEERISEMGS
jgi:5-(carboxyamino)imidazole ribonucleotide synthase